MVIVIILTIFSIATQGQITHAYICWLLQKEDGQHWNTWMIWKLKLCDCHILRLNICCITARRSQLLWGWQCVCGGSRGARRRLGGGEDPILLHFFPPLRCHRLQPLHPRQQQMLRAGEGAVQLSYKDTFVFVPFSLLLTDTRSGMFNFAFYVHPFIHYWENMRMHLRLRMWQECKRWADHSRELSDRSFTCTPYPQEGNSGISLLCCRCCLITP